jgi:hypothetical protein
MHKLRNVTVTLEEHVARWARVEAAKRNRSVSRYLGDVLKEQMDASAEYQAAKKRALNRKPFLKTNDRYLSREEAHERARIR